MLGVSLSGAILQGVLLQRLRVRISGSDADKAWFFPYQRKFFILTNFFEPSRLFTWYSKGLFVFLRCVGMDKRSLPVFSFHRHSAEIIPKLDPLTRQAAIDSYADALRVVFICQAAINVCGFLACLPIQENALPWVLDKADFQKWCAYNRAFFRSTPSRRVPSSLENEEGRGH